MNPFRALAFAIFITSTFAEASPWPAAVPGFVAPRAGEHPRLFFRRADLPELKRRAQTAEGKVIVERLRFLLNGADGATLPELFNPTRSDKEGSGDFHKTAPDGKAFTLWHGAGYGMLFQLTGERKYADFGRQCVEKMIEGQRDRDDRYSFVGPHGALRAGPSLGAMAMAYDLCHDGWDAEFRKRVALEIQNYNQGPMIWGLGERIEWGQCPKSSSSRVTQVKPDGSGVFTAQAVSLAVDFSKASGADALIVWTGPGAGGPAKGGGEKVKTQQVTIGTRIYDVLTVSARGEHPEAKAEGEAVVIGKRKISFKNDELEWETP